MINKWIAYISLLDMLMLSIGVFSSSSSSLWEGGGGGGGGCQFCDVAKVVIIHTKIWPDFPIYEIFF